MSPKPTETPTARALAGVAVQAVLDAGRSLSQVLPDQLAQAGGNDRALVQELAYGTLRWRYRLMCLCSELLKRPLKAKDQDIAALLLVGLYQLGYTSIAAHAAVHATVEAVRATGKAWAVPLANAVLRRYQRERAALDARVDCRDSCRYAHPEWLIARLQTDWPQHWQAILEANNARPPFVLRVNPAQHDRAGYQAMLQAEGMVCHALGVADQGLYLEQPVAVERLPGFTDGAVSVQDTAAQLAAPLLAVRAGMRVLDACAAPGGKTAHILESASGIELVALDNDAQRAARIEATLQRLRRAATIVVGDAGAPAAWWDGRPFDRILLDAPCSATGVIRRHPDIKSLRRADDITALVAAQARLLDAVWPLLAPGGMLLYATCSILRQENEEQIAGFLQRHPAAREVALDVDWGIAGRHGRQLLPGMPDPAQAAVGMDGFYYARLVKQDR